MSAPSVTSPGASKKKEKKKKNKNKGFSFADVGDVFSPPADEIKDDDEEEEKEEKREREKEKEEEEKEEVSARKSTGAKKKKRKGKKPVSERRVWKAREGLVCVCVRAMKRTGNKRIDVD